MARDLARKYHPDKAEGEGIPKEEAEKKFREIAEAYEVWAVLGCDVIFQVLHS
jgi:DnaJ-class molecular chaperone